MNYEEAVDEAKVLAEKTGREAHAVRKSGEEYAALFGEAVTTVQPDAVVEANDAQAAHVAKLQEFYDWQEAGEVQANSLGRPVFGYRNDAGECVVEDERRALSLPIRTFHPTAETGVIEADEALAKDFKELRDMMNSADMQQVLEDSHPVDMVYGTDKACIAYLTDLCKKLVVALRDDDEELNEFFGDKETHDRRHGSYTAHNEAVQAAKEQYEEEGDPLYVLPCDHGYEIVEQCGSIAAIPENNLPIMDRATACDKAAEAADTSDELAYLIGDDERGYRIYGGESVAAFEPMDDQFVNRQVWHKRELTHACIERDCNDFAVNFSGPMGRQYCPTHERHKKDADDDDRDTRRLVAPSPAPRMPDTCRAAGCDNGALTGGYCTDHPVIPPFVSDDRSGTQTGRYRAEVPNDAAQPTAVRDILEAGYSGKQPGQIGFGVDPMHKDLYSSDRFDAAVGNAVIRANEIEEKVFVVKQADGSFKILECRDVWTVLSDKMAECEDLTLSEAAILAEKNAAESNTNWFVVQSDDDRSYKVLSDKRVVLIRPPNASGLVMFDISEARMKAIKLRAESGLAAYIGGNSEIGYRVYGEEFIESYGMVASDPMTVKKVTTGDQNVETITPPPEERQHGKMIRGPLADQIRESLYEGYGGKPLSLAPKWVEIMPALLAMIAYDEDDKKTSGIACTVLLDLAKQIDG